MSNIGKQRWVLINTLHALIGDAELVLKDVEAGRLPSRDLEGTFRVNCEVSLKKLREVRTLKEGQ